MIRILIVDDSTIILSALSDLLRLYSDIEVIGLARDGLEAVEKAGELLPDMVIMDVRMPNLGGLEAAGRIKKARSTVGILFLSSHTDYADSGISAGGDGYLTKPPEGRELVSQVRQIAAKYQNQRRESV